MGHSLVNNLQNFTHNNPYIYLISFNAYAKFYPFINKILSGNEILTQVKGHNSFENFQKSTHTYLNSDLAIINAYMQIIEWKQN